MSRSPLIVNRKPIKWTSDKARVITRLFLPGDGDRIGKVARRVAQLSEEEAKRLLDETRAQFARRHRDIDIVLRDHFSDVAEHVANPDALTEAKKLLIGSFFTMEYSVESAALFNPSIVVAPDQGEVAPGHMRIILTFRATGEGHLSSLEFREAVLTDANDLILDPICPYLDTPKLAHNVCYGKELFGLRMIEMSVPQEPSAEGSASLFQSNEVISDLLERLDPCFTLDQLHRAMRAMRGEGRFEPPTMAPVFERVQWLAGSNYEVRFDPATCLSERVLFPVSMNERHGMKDARFVRLVDGDDVTYYATYTAFDGDGVQTQLLETRDFLNFTISTLNGKYANSKGMALFPRRVNGRYAMVSRVDGENLFLMFSDDVRFWHVAHKLQEPIHPWEFVQIGNCGSPIETDEGWLLITHGVGPMRRYCIGAMLLDLEDPLRVRGRLAEPIIAPRESEREGYVPNVVYTCGSLVHNGELVIPYAMSDTASSIATVPLGPLLDALRGK